MPRKFLVRVSGGVELVTNADSVERTIVFYRLRELGGQSPPGVDFGERVVQAVRGLDQAQNAHLQELAPDRLVAGYGLHHKGFPTLKLGAVRRNDLPQIQSGSDIRDLEIAVDEGLMEISHFVFFPNGIVGAEYNHRGPRATAIPGYLRDRLEEDVVPPVRSAVLVNQETASLIRGMSSYSLIEIEITRGNLEIVRQANDQDGNLFDALDANADALGGESIHIVVGHAPRSPSRLSPSRIPLIRRLAQREDLVRAASKFKIQGLDLESGHDIEVDLLKQHIIAKATVAKVGRNRVVSTLDMLDAIVTAREELLGQIATAADAATT